MITRILEDGVLEQDLGEVIVAAAETIAGFSVTPVCVGNPHAVVIGDPDTIVEIGPLLETHPRFPDRTNVQVARIDAPGEVTARVWERGVGETASSGTSAVAVAAATHGEGEVVVRFPGGISAYASRTAERCSTALPSACPESGLRELDEPAVRIAEIGGSAPRVVPRLDEELSPLDTSAAHVCRGRRRRSRSDPRSAGRRPCSGALVDEQLASPTAKMLRPAIGDRRSVDQATIERRRSRDIVREERDLAEAVMSRSRTRAGRRSATS